METNLKFLQIYSIILIVTVQLRCHTTEMFSRQTCAEIKGPRYRCVSREACDSAPSRPIAREISCGPDDVGVCCPLVHQRNYPRCGIRKRSMEYRQHSKLQEATESYFANNNVKTEAPEKDKEQHSDKPEIKNPSLPKNLNSLSTSGEFQVLNNSTEIKQLNDMPKSEFPESTVFTDNTEINQLNHMPKSEFLESTAFTDNTEINKLNHMPKSEFVENTVFTDNTEINKLNHMPKSEFVESTVFTDNTEINQLNHMPKSEFLESTVFTDNTEINELDHMPKSEFVESTVFTDNTEINQLNHMPKSEFLESTVFIDNTAINERNHMPKSEFVESTVFTDNTEINQLNHMPKSEFVESTVFTDNTEINELNHMPKSEFVESTVFTDNTEINQLNHTPKREFLESTVFTDINMVTGSIRMQPEMSMSTIPLPADNRDSFIHTTRQYKNKELTGKKFFESTSFTDINSVTERKFMEPGISSSATSLVEGNNKGNYGLISTTSQYKSDELPETEFHESTFFTDIDIITEGNISHLGIPTTETSINAGNSAEKDEFYRTTSRYNNESLPETEFYERPSSPDVDAITGDKAVPVESSSDYVHTLKSMDMLSDEFSTWSSGEKNKISKDSTADQYEMLRLSDLSGNILHPKSIKENATDDGGLYKTVSADTVVHEESKNTFEIGDYYLLNRTDYTLIPTFPLLTESELESPKSGWITDTFVKTIPVGPNHLNTASEYVTTSINLSEDTLREIGNLDYSEHAQTSTFPSLTESEHDNVKTIKLADNSVKTVPLYPNIQNTTSVYESSLINSREETITDMYNINYRKHTEQTFSPLFAESEHDDPEMAKITEVVVKISPVGPNVQITTSVFETSGISSTEDSADTENLDYAKHTQMPAFQLLSESELDKPKHGKLTDAFVKITPVGSDHPDTASVFEITSSSSNAGTLKESRTPDYSDFVPSFFNGVEKEILTASEIPRSYLSTKFSDPVASNEEGKEILTASENPRSYSTTEFSDPVASNEGRKEILTASENSRSYSTTKFSDPVASNEAGKEILTVSENPRSYSANKFSDSVTSNEERKELLTLSENYRSYSTSNFSDSVALNEEGKEILTASDSTTKESYSTTKFSDKVASNEEEKEILTANENPRSYSTTKVSDPVASSEAGKEILTASENPRSYSATKFSDPVASYGEGKEILTTSEHPRSYSATKFSDPVASNEEGKEILTASENPRSYSTIEFSDPVASNEGRKEILTASENPRSYSTTKFSDPLASNEAGKEIRTASENPGSYSETKFSDKVASNEEEKEILTANENPRSYSKTKFSDPVASNEEGKEILTASENPRSYSETKFSNPVASNEAGKEILTASENPRSYSATEFSDPVASNEEGKEILTASEKEGYDFIPSDSLATDKRETIHRYFTNDLTYTKGFDFKEINPVTYIFYREHKTETGLPSKDREDMYDERPIKRKSATPMVYEHKDASTVVTSGGNEVHVKTNAKNYENTEDGEVTYANQLYSKAYTEVPDASKVYASTDSTLMKTNEAGFEEQVTSVKQSQHHVFEISEIRKQMEKFLEDLSSKFKMKLDSMSEKFERKITETIGTFFNKTGSYDLYPKLKFNNSDPAASPPPVSSRPPSYSTASEHYQSPSTKLNNNPFSKIPHKISNSPVIQYNSRIQYRFKDRQEDPDSYHQQYPSALRLHDYANFYETQCRLPPCNFRFSYRLPQISYRASFPEYGRPVPLPGKYRHRREIEAKYLGIPENSERYLNRVTQDTEEQLLEEIFDISNKESASQKEKEGIANATKPNDSNVEHEKDKSAEFHNTDVNFKSVKKYTTLVYKTVSEPPEITDATDTVFLREKGSSKGDRTMDIERRRRNEDKEETFIRVLYPKNNEDYDDGTSEISLGHQRCLTCSISYRTKMRTEDEYRDWSGHPTQSNGFPKQEEWGTTKDYINTKGNLMEKDKDYEETSKKFPDHQITYRKKTTGGNYEDWYGHPTRGNSFRKQGQFANDREDKTKVQNTNVLQHRKKENKHKGKGSTIEYYTNAKDNIEEHLFPSMFFDTTTDYYETKLETDDLFKISKENELNSKNIKLYRNKIYHYEETSSKGGNLGERSSDFYYDTMTEEYGSNNAKLKISEKEPIDTPEVSIKQQLTPQVTDSKISLPLSKSFLETNIHAKNENNAAVLGNPSRTKSDNFSQMNTKDRVLERIENKYKYGVDFSPGTKKDDLKLSETTPDSEITTSGAKTDDLRKMTTKDRVLERNENKYKYGVNFSPGTKKDDLKLSATTPDSEITTSGTKSDYLRKMTTKDRVLERNENKYKYGVNFSPGTKKDDLKLSATTPDSQITTSGTKTDYLRKMTTKDRVLERIENKFKYGVDFSPVTKKDDLKLSVITPDSEITTSGKKSDYLRKMTTKDRVLERIENKFKYGVDFFSPGTKKDDLKLSAITPDSEITTSVTKSDYLRKMTTKDRVLERIENKFKYGVNFSSVNINTNHKSFKELTRNNILQFTETFTNSNNYDDTSMSTVTNYSDDITINNSASEINLQFRHNTTYYEDPNIPHLDKQSSLFFPFDNLTKKYPGTIETEANIKISDRRTFSTTETFSAEEDLTSDITVSKTSIPTFVSSGDSERDEKDALGTEEASTEPTQVLGDNDSITTPPIVDDKQNFTTENVKPFKVTSNERPEYRSYLNKSTEYYETDLTTNDVFTVSQKSSKDTSLSLVTNYSDDITINNSASEINLQFRYNTTYYEDSSIENLDKQSSLYFPFDNVTKQYPVNAETEAINNTSDRRTFDATQTFSTEEELTSQISISEITVPTIVSSRDSELDEKDALGTQETSAKLIQMLDSGSITNLPIVYEKVNFTTQNVKPFKETSNEQLPYRSYLNKSTEYYESNLETNDSLTPFDNVTKQYPVNSETEAINNTSDRRTFDATQTFSTEEELTSQISISEITVTTVVSSHDSELDEKDALGTQETSAKLTQMFGDSGSVTNLPIVYEKVNFTTQNVKPFKDTFNEQLAYRSYLNKSTEYYESILETNDSLIPFDNVTKQYPVNAETEAINNTSDRRTFDATQTFSTEEELTSQISISEITVTTVVSSHDSELDEKDALGTQETSAKLTQMFGDSGSITNLPIVYEKVNFTTQNVKPFKDTFNEQLAYRSYLNKSTEYYESILETNDSLIPFDNVTKQYPVNAETEAINNTSDRRTFDATQTFSTEEELTSQISISEITVPTVVSSRDSELDEKDALGTQETSAKLTQMFGDSDSITNLPIVYEKVNFTTQNVKPFNETSNEQLAYRSYLNKSTEYYESNLETNDSLTVSQKTLYVITEEFLSDREPTAESHSDRKPTVVNVSCPDFESTLVTMEYDFNKSPTEGTSESEKMLEGNVLRTTSSEVPSSSQSTIPDFETKIEKDLDDLSSRHSLIETSTKSYDFNEIKESLFETIYSEGYVGSTTIAEGSFSQNSELPSREIPFLVFGSTVETLTSGLTNDTQEIPSTDNDGDDNKLRSTALLYRYVTSIPYRDGIEKDNFHEFSTPTSLVDIQSEDETFFVAKSHNLTIYRSKYLNKNISTGGNVENLTGEDLFLSSNGTGSLGFETTTIEFDKVGEKLTTISDQYDLTFQTADEKLRSSSSRENGRDKTIFPNTNVLDHEITDMYEIESLKQQTEPYLYSRTTNTGNLVDIKSDNVDNALIEVTLKRIEEEYEHKDTTFLSLETFPDTKLTNDESIFNEETEQSTYSEENDTTMKEESKFVSDEMLSTEKHASENTQEYSDSYLRKSSDSNQVTPDHLSTVLSTEDSGLWGLETTVLESNKELTIIPDQYDLSFETSEENLISSNYRDNGGDKTIFPNTNVSDHDTTNMYETEILKQRTEPYLDLGTTNAEHLKDIKTDKIDNAQDLSDVTLKQITERTDDALDIKIFSSAESSLSEGTDQSTHSEQRDARFKEKATFVSDETLVTEKYSINETRKYPSSFSSERSETDLSILEYLTTDLISEDSGAFRLETSPSDSYKVYEISTNISETLSTKEKNTVYPFTSEESPLTTTPEKENANFTKVNETISMGESGRLKSNLEEHFRNTVNNTAAVGTPSQSEENMKLTEVAKKDDIKLSATTPDSEFTTSRTKSDNVSQMTSKDRILERTENKYKYGGNFSLVNLNTTHKNFKDFTENNILHFTETYTDSNNFDDTSTSLITNYNDNIMINYSASEINLQFRYNTTYHEEPSIENLDKQSSLLTSEITESKIFIPTFTSYRDSEIGEKHALDTGESSSEPTQVLDDSHSITTLPVINKEHFTTHSIRMFEGISNEHPEYRSYINKSTEYYEGNLTTNVVFTVSQKIPNGITEEFFSDREPTRDFSVANVSFPDFKITLETMGYDFNKSATEVVSESEQIQEEHVSRTTSSEVHSSSQSSILDYETKIEKDLDDLSSQHALIETSTKNYDFNEFNDSSFKALYSEGFIGSTTVAEGNSDPNSELPSSEITHSVFGSTATASKTIYGGDDNKLRSTTLLYRYMTSIPYEEGTEEEEINELSPPSPLLDIQSEDETTTTLNSAIYRNKSNKNTSAPENFENPTESLDRYLVTLDNLSLIMSDSSLLRLGTTPLDSDKVTEKLTTLPDQYDLTFEPAEERLRNRSSLDNGGDKTLSRNTEVSDHETTNMYETESLEQRTETYLNSRTSNTGHLIDIKTDKMGNDQDLSDVTLKHTTERTDDALNAKILSSAQSILREGTDQATHAEENNVRIKEATFVSGETSVTQNYSIKKTRIYPSSFSSEWSDTDIAIPGYLTTDLSREDSGAFRIETSTSNPDKVYEVLTNISDSLPAEEKNTAYTIASEDIPLTKTPEKENANFTKATETIGVEESSGSESNLEEYFRHTVNSTTVLGTPSESEGSMTLTEITIKVDLKLSATTLDSEISSSGKKSDNYSKMTTKDKVLERIENKYKYGVNFSPVNLNTTHKNFKDLTENNILNLTEAFTDSNNYDDTSMSTVTNYSDDITINNSASEINLQFRHNTTYYEDPNIENLDKQSSLYFPFDNLTKQYPGTIETEANIRISDRRTFNTTETFTAEDLTSDITVSKTSIPTFVSSRDSERDEKDVLGTEEASTEPTQVLGDNDSITTLPIVDDKQHFTTENVKPFKVTSNERPQYRSYLNKSTEYYETDLTTNDVFTVSQKSPNGITEGSTEPTQVLGDNDSITTLPIVDDKQNFTTENVKPFKVTSNERPEYRSYLNKSTEYYETDLTTNDVFTVSQKSPNGITEGFLFDRNGTTDASAVSVSFPDFESILLTMGYDFYKTPIEDASESEQILGGNVSRTTSTEVHSSSLSSIPNYETEDLDDLSSHQSSIETSTKSYDFIELKDSSFKTIYSEGFVRSSTVLEGSSDPNSEVYSSEAPYSVFGGTVETLTAGSTNDAQEIALKEIDDGDDNKLRSTALLYGYVTSIPYVDGAEKERVNQMSTPTSLVNAESEDDLFSIMTTLNFTNYRSNIIHNKNTSTIENFENFSEEDHLLRSIGTRSLGFETTALESGKVGEKLTTISEEYDLAFETTEEKLRSRSSLDNGGDKTILRNTGVSDHETTNMYETESLEQRTETYLNSRTANTGHLVDIKTDNADNDLTEVTLKQSKENYEHKDTTFLFLETFPDKNLTSDQSIFYGGTEKSKYSEDNTKTRIKEKSTSVADGMLSTENYSSANTQEYPNSYVSESSDSNQVTPDYVSSVFSMEDSGLLGLETTVLESNKVTEKLSPISESLLSKALNGTEYSFLAEKNYTLNISTTNGDEEPTKLVTTDKAISGSKFDTLGYNESILYITDSFQAENKTQFPNTELNETAVNSMNYLTSDMLPASNTKGKSLIYEYITRHLEPSPNSVMIPENNFVSSQENLLIETSFTKSSGVTETSTYEVNNYAYSSLRNGNSLTSEEGDLDVNFSMSEIENTSESEDTYTPKQSNYTTDVFRGTLQSPNQAIKAQTTHNISETPATRINETYLYRYKVDKSHTNAYDETEKEFSETFGAVNDFTPRNDSDVLQTKGGESDVQNSTENVYDTLPDSTSKNMAEPHSEYSTFPNIRSTPKIAQISEIFTNPGTDSNTKGQDDVNTPVYSLSFSAGDSNETPAIKENYYSTSERNGQDILKSNYFDSGDINYSNGNVQAVIASENSTPFRSGDKYHSTTLTTKSVGSEMTGEGRSMHATLSSLETSKTVSVSDQPRMTSSLDDDFITENRTDSEDDWLSESEVQNMNSEHTDEKTVIDSHKNSNISNDSTSVNILPNVPVIDSPYKMRSEKRSENPLPSDIDYTRTIGGRLEYIDWPWVVSIYRADDMSFICAGTLIDERHVLSAAHCMFDHLREKFVVSVGNLLKIARRRDALEVDNIFLHEGFEPSCYCNDVSLLRLAVRLGPEHIPVCLPSYDTAAVGENSTLLGWGDRKYIQGPGDAGSWRLQRVDNLPIVSSRECRKIVSDVMHRRLPIEFEEYYLCAGVPDGSLDACLGDSGGPLLHQDYEGSWTLLGIVSFGYKCGEPGVPGTYSRVSYYMPWILSHIGH